MSIYVNGDSWSFALKEQGSDYPHLWPNIVATRLGTTCINESVGCGSNSRIVDCLRNQIILDLKPELVIIALTAHHRSHMPAANFGAWSIGPNVARNDRTGDSNEQIRDFMVRHSYNELDSIYRYYRDIWTMDLLCQQLNCPYIFVQCWDEELEALGLLESWTNIHSYVNSQCPTPTFYSGEYIRAFEKFKELSKNWPYVEKALSKSLDKQTDYNATHHPNDRGHYKMANKILELLEGLPKK